MLFSAKNKIHEISRQRKNVSLMWHKKLLHMFFVIELIDKSHVGLLRT